MVNLTFQQRVRSILISDSSIAELLASSPAFIWGAVLAMPFSTFSSNPTAYQYLMWMPENVWAGMFLVFFGLCVIAWHRQIYGMRRFMMLAGIFLWVFMGAIIISGNPHGLGLLQTAHAVCALLAYIQLTVANAARTRGTV
jgi:hypothetical protein